MSLSLKNPLVLAALAAGALLLVRRNAGATVARPVVGAAAVNPSPLQRAVAALGAIAPLFAPAGAPDRSARYGAEWGFTSPYYGGTDAATGWSPAIMAQSEIDGAAWRANVGDLREGDPYQ